jgi:DNA-binding NtrC family response regulator
MKQQVLPRILVVDDEQDMLETCQKMLSFRSYHVDITQQPEQALQLFAENPPDLMILDLKMPQMNGLELMKRIHQTKGDQLVVFITAHASVENAMQAVRAGAFDFIRKPFKMDDLLLVVDRALRFKMLQDENRRLQEKLHEAFRADRIVGSSGVLKEALVRLRKVCEVDVPILISGESGTGKELFAWTIHENSIRKEKPFLVVNCAALPEPLLESELFGYEKGAFTGAATRKAGLLEAASGGTVLLDEIGEMSPNLQAKLLRSIQEGCVRRLGGNQEQRVDVRIISATHRDIEAMVKERSFREDLYYRINVVAITVPPLRDRMGDIPRLANYFFDEISSRVSKNIEGISAAALLILEEYDWPGNVRELRNAIERAYTLAESTQILPQDLPPAILSAVEEKDMSVGRGDFHETKLALIEDFERKYLESMLSRTRGNVTEAARFSGLSRPVFHRLMSKFGINSADFKDQV